MSLYKAKYSGQIFPQTSCFIEGQYLARIKLQIIAKQIGCVDAACPFFFVQAQVD